MALTKTNLNQDIDQKISAYARDPSLMGQRRPLSEDLVGALAMQQMKSEKADKEKNINLAMQNNPSTIVEQYEQELAQRSQQELAKQTAGIMQERNKLKQQEMARPPAPKGITQGASQGAPQQPKIMTAAVGGLMQVPRPNMRNMAQGGILGYQAGGAIEKVKELIADRGGKLTQQEMSDVVNMVKQNPEVIAYLEQNQGYISAEENAEIDSAVSLQKQDSEDISEAVVPDIKPAASIVAEPPKGAPVATSGIAAATANKGQRPLDVPPAGAAIANSGIAAATAQGQEEEEEEEKQAGLASIVAGMQQEQDDMNAQPAPVKTPLDSTKDARGNTKFDDTQLQAAQKAAKIQAPPAPPAPPVNNAFTVRRKGGASVNANAPADPDDNVIEQGLASLRDKGLTPDAPTGISSTRYSDTLDPAVMTANKDAMAKDPDQEMLSEERRLDLRFNIEENATKREAQLKILRDLTDFDYSPEKRRSDSISAWMRGVGKGGTGLVYGSMAMANEESKQKRELYARRLKEFQLTNENIAAKVDSLNKVSTLAGNLYASVVKDRRAAIALATVVPQRDLEAFDRAKTAESDRLDRGVKNQLAALKIEAANEYNKINAEIAKAANNTNKIKILDGAIARNKKKIAEETARIEALPEYGMNLITAKAASSKDVREGTNNATEDQRRLIIQSLSDIQSGIEDLGYNKLQKYYEEILEGMVGV